MVCLLASLKDFYIHFKNEFYSVGVLTELLSVPLIIVCVCMGFVCVCLCVCVCVFKETKYSLVLSK